MGYYECIGRGYSINIVSSAQIFDMMYRDTIWGIYH